MEIDGINSGYRVGPINPIGVISDRQQNPPNYFYQQQTKQTKPDNQSRPKGASDTGLYIDIFA